MTSFQYHERHKRIFFLFRSFFGPFSAIFRLKKATKSKFFKNSKKNLKKSQKILKNRYLFKKIFLSQTGNFRAIFRLKKGITNPGLLVFQFWYWACFVPGSAVEHGAMSTLLYQNILKKIFLMKFTHFFHKKGNYSSAVHEAPDRCLKQACIYVCI